LNGDQENLEEINDEALKAGNINKEATMSIYLES